jgi:hypothetical protein
MPFTAARTSIFALAAALAACGGPSTPAATTPPSNTGGEGTAKEPGAEPFDKEAVRATLASMAVPEVCGSPEDAASLGELLELRGRDLGTPDQVDMTFTCRSFDEGQWQCEWSVFTKPSPLDPDDPCSDMGATGFQIITQVDATGALVPDTLGCVAPG